MTALFRSLLLCMLGLALSVAAQHRLALPSQPAERGTIARAGLSDSSRAELGLVAASEPGQRAAGAEGQKATSRAAAQGIGVRPCWKGQGPDLLCQGDLLLPRRPGLPQPQRQSGLMPPLVSSPAAGLFYAPGLRPPRRA